MNFKKIGLSLLAGVTLFASSSNLSALAQEENETVKIGANMETSGYSASYGQAMYEALQLAVEEVNNEGEL